MKAHLSVIKEEAFDATFVGENRTIERLSPPRLSKHDQEKNLKEEEDILASTS